MWGQNLEEAMFVYILMGFSGGKQAMTVNCSACSSTLCYDDFCIKTDTGDKIKYSRIPKNTEAQQENTKENTKKTTEINWDWSKKFPD